MLTVTRVSQPPAAAPAAMLIVVDGLLMSVDGLAGCKIELNLAIEKIFSTVYQSCNVLIYVCKYLAISTASLRSIVLRPLYPPSSPPGTSHPRPPAPEIPTTAPPASW